MVFFFSISNKKVVQFIIRMNDFTKPAMVNVRRRGKRVSKDMASSLQLLLSSTEEGQ